MNSSKLIFSVILILTTFLADAFYSQGKVYIVFGSDTAIWDGMSVSSYNCNYKFDLYTDHLKNAYKVMSKEFREPLLDSYGNAVKFTWWMMAGNIFRYAVNNDIPIANIMTLYLMKKYHGESIDYWGDELSLHYHTFTWTDYDNDGVYYWNQAKNFLECKEDWDVTLAQFLLEENVFPVSFRSGWHYMDNEWQSELNDVLLYSLHNDWPAKRYTEIEPIDNNFDWSRAPSVFVPFQPKDDDYQLPGGNRGWNVRSKYTGSVTQALINDVFQKAGEGIDQVVCLWSHLPEETFLTDIQKINNYAHIADSIYPGVDFQYCTAIEAMQLWRECNDTVKPELFISDENGKSGTFLKISVNEPIFQTQPFIAIKDIYENFRVEPCVQVGSNEWRTQNSYNKSETGKIGAAVTDAFGNLSTAFINYLPDDIIIDNSDAEYIELNGIWSSSTSKAWGLDSRIATIAANDTPRVRWNLPIQRDGLYNIFFQIPNIANTASKFIFIIKRGAELDTVVINDSPSPKKWIFIANKYIYASEINYLEMYSYGETGKIVPADVIKVSAYVKSKALSSETDFINIGEVSLEDSIAISLKLSNYGVNPLTITEIFSGRGDLFSFSSYPIVIDGMSSFDIDLILAPKELGSFSDSLYIISDDPVNPNYKIPYAVDVKYYIKIIDNEESLYYYEIGDWRNSVAQAYKASSRYAMLVKPNGGPSAYFHYVFSKSGLYDIHQIVPKATNSANKALYVIWAGGNVVDSVYIDQNQNSGSWIKLGSYVLPAGVQIKIGVIDDGKSSAGDVLRADAMRFELLEELNISGDRGFTPAAFSLEQNYPNPFNSSTSIRYSLSKKVFASLKVFDALGREIIELVGEEQDAGIYYFRFDASKLASGVYYYRLHAGDFIQAKKMVLAK